MPPDVTAEEPSATMSHLMGPTRVLFVTIPNRATT